MKKHRGVLFKGLAVIGAVPLLWFVAMSLSREVPRLLVDDPCYLWGQTSSAAISVGRSKCTIVEATSETKAAAVARLAAIQGTVLVATVLALVGSFRGRRRLCVAGFAMLFVVSMPLLLSGLGMATLACAVCFIPSCYGTTTGKTSS
jgi:hypothetical protein